MSDKKKEQLTVSWVESVLLPFLFLDLGFCAVACIQLDFGKCLVRVNPSYSSQVYVPGEAGSKEDGNEKQVSMISEEATAEVVGP